MGFSRRRKGLEAVKQLIFTHSNAIIVSHKHADVDALASLLALAYVLKHRFGYAEVVSICPEGPSAQALSVARKIGLEPSCKPSALPSEVADTGVLAFFVDVGSVTQLGPLKWTLELPAAKVLIDHHSDGDLKALVDYAIAPPRAFSTSEIVAAIFGNLIDDEKIAAILLAGIVHDTSRFRRASPQTFKSSALLSRLADYNKLMLVMKEEEDLSKRVAKLKAAQRAVVENVGELLISVTHVGSFESDVANALVSLGSDLVAVVSPKDSETRVVVRASERVSEDLWRGVLDKVARELDWPKAGGHARAAVFTVERVYQKRELPKVCRMVADSIAGAVREAAGEKHSAPIANLRAKAGELGEHDTMGAQ